ncbi:MAG TPA: ABC transporter permease [Bacillota bacterium]|nr:ABC transporter permease [Bacillota bacterium]
MTDLALDRDKMKRKGRFARFLKQLFANKMARFGGTVIFLLFLLAVFAPVIAPYEYDAMNLPEMLKAPGFGNILGTDEFGRDVFSRIVYGTRISFTVGFLAVGISLLIGTILGALAGYYGGALDYVISGITDIAWSFPVTLLAIAFVAALGPSLINMIIAMAIVSWSGFARLVRGQFLSLREKEFVQAARVLGMRDRRIIFRHMLPNALAPVIVLTTLEVPKAIIVEASLSFLGLGAQPPTPSWGAIMNSGKSYLMEAPWISIFPGLMIVVIVMGFNLFGDALRDTLDPRLKD